jgi:hypothetical protein
LWGILLKVTLQEKLDSILPAVAEEMLKVDAGRLDALVFKQATSMVYEIAVMRWLAEDLENFEYIETPEMTFEFEGTKGIIDLTGRIKQNPPSSAYKKYAGKKFVVDWKTSSTSVLSDTWKHDYLNSWQWRIYSAATNASLFIYRGMTRGEFDLTRAVKSLQIEVPEDNDYQVREHIRKTRLSMKAFENETTWPRYWPNPCRKWGGCPFHTDCFNNTQPEGLVTIPDLLSYSKISAFQDCPEKYRRLLLTQKEADANENTIFGNVVHAGLAVIYKEMFNV